MLIQNKDIFDYINLSQYHEKGFTGKGVKVFVLEPNKDHRIGVIKCLQQSAPDCEILTIDGRTELNYKDMLINSKTNLITCSYTLKYIEPNESKILIDNGISMFVCIGNEGTNGRTAELAKDENWISVGAMTLNNGIPKIEDYSSRSPRIDTAMFIPYYMGSYVFRPLGTSFSTPFLTGMMACYFQYFKAKYDRFPIHSEVIELLQNNSKDLGTVGFDITFGNGVFIMPDIPETTIRLTIGKNIAYVNGQQIILDVPAKIENSRTLVPIRFIAESLSCQVEWDETNRQVIIIK